MQAGASSYERRRGRGTGQEPDTRERFAEVPGRWMCATPTQQRAHFHGLSLSSFPLLAPACPTFCFRRLTPATKVAPRGSGRAWCSPRFPGTLLAASRWMISWSSFSSQFQVSRNCGILFRIFPIDPVDSRVLNPFRECSMGNS